MIFPTAAWSDPRISDLTTAPTTRPAAPPEPRFIVDGERATLVYPCRHAQPEVLLTATEALLSPEGTAHASPELNALVIVDRADLVRSIRTVLEELDTRTAQLLVEARVVEVSVDRQLEYEIRHALTVPPGDSSFFQNSEVDLLAPGDRTPAQGLDLALRAWDANGNMLNTFVRLLNSRGQARILSSPNLIVSPGGEASIITGEEVPVQSSTIAGGSIQTTTQFKRVGIKLRVSLLQLTEDTARLQINPEVSTVTGFTESSEGVASNPIIAIRNVTSTLSLKDGEVLTVGGLLRNERRVSTRGVPLLEDVPLVGLLFQSQFNTMVRTQLIFFLRVRILRDGRPEEIRVHQPGAGLDVLNEVTDPDTLPTGDGPLPSKEKSLK